MTTLLIETSTERGLTALHDGSKLLRYTDLPFGYQNSKFLLPTIEEMLASTHSDIHQLTLIACGIGPGSYTGIRAGAIVAKTLSYALQIPLVGICSLEGFVPKNNGKFVAMIDAKIGGAYLIKGQKTDHDVTYISQPIVSPLIEIAEHLIGIETIVTPYCQTLQEKMKDLFPEKNWIWEETAPSANALMKRALQKFALKQVSYDSHLDLLYLRKTQAEIEKEK